MNAQPKQTQITHVWGCDGSSPRETLSPWISLKHFSQKWYLSARRPYLGELLHPHNTAQVKQRSHQSQQAKEGTGAESRSSTATRIFNDADLWAPHCVWLVWVFLVCFFFFCAIKAKCRQWQAWRRNKITHTRTKKWRFAGQKQKHRSRTRQHKAESQGKAQISIKSLKWVHKQQMINAN